MIICNPISGILYDKMGIKKLSLFGFGMLVVGTLPMLLFNTQTGLITICVCYALRMVGISFTMMTTFTAGINLIDPQLTAHANAASSTVRQIGGSFGTAAAMLVVALASTVNTSSKGVALEMGFHWSFILMLLFAVIGFGSSFFLLTSQEENK